MWFFPRRCKLRSLARLFAGIGLGAVVLTGAAQAASLVPSETYCEFGCEITDQTITSESPVEAENPLRPFVPTQDFIGDFTASPGDLLYLLRPSADPSQPAEEADEDDGGSSPQ